MANISNVEGTLVFTASDKATLDATIDVFHIASSFGYNTSFSVDEIKTSTNEKGHIVGTVPFYGSGRWSYSTNAEHMITWINEELSSVNEKTLATVTETWFDVTVDWREYELGCCFVASGSTQYHKDAGEPFDKTVTTLLNEGSAHLSVPSMRAFGFDAELYTDFSREGIKNFIDYFTREDPNKIGELNRYTLDQLADAMKDHEHDVFYELEYLHDEDEDIEDYRKCILDRVRQ